MCELVVLSAYHENILLHKAPSEIKWRRGTIVAASLPLDHEITFHDQTRNLRRVH